MGRSYADFSKVLPHTRRHAERIAMARTTPLEAPAIATRNAQRCRFIALAMSQLGPFGLPTPAMPLQSVDESTLLQSHVEGTVLRRVMMLSMGPANEPLQIELTLTDAPCAARPAATSTMRTGG
jgi:hypothetical protein